LLGLALGSSIGKGKKMLNCICSSASSATAFASDALDVTVPADFYRLSGEQIERLIARHETPTLWRLDPEPVHAPEPFGMIA
jgi:hypothetical protein